MFVSIQWVSLRKLLKQNEKRSCMYNASNRNRTKRTHALESKTKSRSGSWSTTHRRQRRRGHEGPDTPIFDLQGSINALDPCSNCYRIMRERREREERKGRTPQYLKCVDAHVYETRTRLQFRENRRIQYSVAHVRSYTVSFHLGLCRDTIRAIKPPQQCIGLITLHERPSPLSGSVI